MRKGYTDDASIIAEILAEADVLWLALTDADGPYCVPVNFAANGNTIYIHTGKYGRKATALATGAPVAFSAAVDVRMRAGGDTACDQGYLFRSIMGQGIPRQLDHAEKHIGLDQLATKYMKTRLPYQKSVLSATIVYAIAIETISARIKE
ncbi:pyridoxamine 5'-phosphate oxidase family protein [Pseudodesulfovibrio sp. JC047]|uniref:pyridoxamine 5'-phosphate oxidase family protein n=1 Tax=Pseudodesulfovibrio sp. JC047 TaxID=2683199 RepID=UPI0013D2A6C6|nr:pyridoxamine 5'-phosphate oxidase family protein [Pseudodesulfovibrio sp. JC047]NDV20740.1 pyridoxamine 5'-phosphate oxidase family protein [Pseudodesulfovibrio sp. JC047]